MTACKNFAKGGKAGRVITAALVATLSVGAPVVALATTGAEGGIDMLATDPNAFAKGTVHYSNGEPGQVFAYGASELLVPDYVMPLGSTTKQTVTLADSDAPDQGYYYFYVDVDDASSTTYDDVKYVNDKNESVALKGTAKYGSTSMNNALGKYAVVLGYYDGSSAWTYLGVADTFTVAGASLDGAVLCDKDDASDTSIAYDASGELTWSVIKDDLRVAVDGVVIDSSKVTIGDAYTQNGVVAAELVPGTTYTVKVSGKANTAYADLTKELTFTFGALDLSSANVVGVTTKTFNGDEAAVKPEALISKIDTVPVGSGALNNYVDITLKSNPSGGTTIDSTEKGVYTFVASAKADQNFVKGSVEFTFSFADDIANIQYNADALSSGLNVDLSKPEPNYFDLEKLTAKYYSDTSTVPAKEIKVTYTDSEGNAATADDLKTVGTWYVNVAVNYKDASGKLVIGSDSLKVVTSYGIIAADANVFLSVNGVNVSSTTDGTTTEVGDYTSDDFADTMSVKVIKGDKTFDESDYTVTLQKKVNGEWVDTDSAIDADTYKVIVKGSEIGLTTAAEFFFKIDKRTITSAEVNYDIVDPNKANSYFIYTGEEIVPSFTFKGDDKKEYDVPADAYELSFTDQTNTSNTEFKDASTYTINIAASAKSKNFTFTVNQITDVKISEQKVFADVASDEWFAQDVYTAVKLGYMGGYSGTQLFGPHDTLTRAQAVITLFKMAGGVDNGSSAMVGSEGSYTENSGYETGFKDVDGHMYYARAIAWAKNSGIVKGYGDGNFGPEDKITRAQFATMLANYAKLKGEYEAVDTDAVLAAYSDGAAVEDWFADDVAWAASNGIIGNGSDLMSSTLIERAQAATMAVRAQSEKLSTAVKPSSLSD